MRKIWVAAAAMAAAFTAAPTEAGVYSDDLGKCMAKNTSATDQLALVRWAFSMMSLHPAIKELANISPAMHAQLDKQARDVSERLGTVDCRKETVEALKYEGPIIFRTSFEVLGQVAFRGLNNDPGVAQAFADWGKSLDREKIVALGREAGLPFPTEK